MAYEDPFVSAAMIESFNGSLAGLCPCEEIVDHRLNLRCGRPAAPEADWVEMHDQDDRSVFFRWIRCADGHRYMEEVR